VQTLVSAILAHYKPAIEAELRDLFASAGPPYTTYYEMLHYHMGWLDADLRPHQGSSGKRVRPVLCLLACEAAGGAIEPCMPAAAGVEALHNFSLLHDDIQDGSATRRGRPTVWKLWGKGQAINAGDGMFALAHLALTRLTDRRVPAERALAAVQVFDQTCLALTHGQHLDMCFEGRLDVSVEEYLTMIRGKTAALFATSVHLGALVAGAERSAAAHYRDFGEHLGLAFQIRDDILGIWGDKEVTGKSTSSDIETRKKTLPVVYGLERSAELQHLYGAKSMTPAEVPRVVHILSEVGARHNAETLAMHHHREAMHALKQSGAEGEAAAALRELATALLTRVS
jgi:geranylgeranyl diphosphate synthase type I